uniref:UDP-glycosyltransferase 72B1-like n=1 Tax=Fragaria vesca subsp. vesca TaxID=101020 RepID=UPI0005C89E76|nr:PREDICTED: UDP-glycosyltransferase 72B1-like [Fragaria vesca subsp. vesca]
MSNSHAQPLLPHIALFPCAGMGHLTPFLRLASMLSSSQNCLLTLITASPAVSAAESTHISLFLSQHPKVNHLEFHLIPSDPTTITIPDPFFLQWQSTNHSLHLLYPSLASASPPLSAIFSDFVVAPSMGTMAAQLNIPNYIFSPTSCKFFCLMAYLPTLLSNTSDISTLTHVEIPGLAPLPMTSIPPVRDMMGESFMERTKNKGIVLKAWVSQQDILEHPAIGGFVNHCGWNSVMEAAREGIPVLAWPQHGDQRVNAEIVEKAGLGIWERKWGWGLEGLASAEEIRNKIVELMEHEKVRSCSKKVGEEARKASGVDGKSEKVVMEIMQSLMQKRN